MSIALRTLLVVLLASMIGCTSYKSFIETESGRSFVIKRRNFTVVTVDSVRYEFVSKGGYAKIVGTEIIGTVRHPDSAYVERKIPFRNILRIEIKEGKEQLPIIIGMGGGIGGTILSQEGVRENLVDFFVKTRKILKDSMPWMREKFTEFWNWITKDLPF